MPGRMPDPFGSMGNMVNQFRSFMANPMQMLSQRLPGIPQGMNDPNQIIQQLMNSGRMSQEQYNFYNQMAQQISGNSQFNQMMCGGNQRK